MSILKAFRIEETLNDKLKELADEKGVKEQFIINESLKEYFKKHWVYEDENKVKHHNL